MSLTPSSTPITPGSGANVAIFTDGTKLYQGVVLVDSNGTPILIDTDSTGLVTAPAIEYNSVPATIPNGGTGRLQGDNLQNLKVSIQSQFTPQQDGIASHIKPYHYVNLTASGQILSSAGALAGFFINSYTAAATIKIFDATTNGPPAIMGVYTVTGTGWFPYGPAELQSGGYALLTGTIDVTFLVRNGLTA